MFKKTFKAGFDEILGNIQAEVREFFLIKTCSCNNTTLRNFAVIAELFVMSILESFVIKIKTMRFKR